MKSNDEKEEENSDQKIVIHMMNFHSCHPMYLVHQKMKSARKLCMNTINTHSKLFGSRDFDVGKRKPVELRRTTTTK